MSRVDRSNSESRRRISGGTETDDSDLPPDSIVVPIDQDTPWQYPAYDSGESTRECTNPKSQSNSFHWSKTGSSSNRVAAANLNASGSAPAPIMGIPAKIKLPGFAHSQSPPSIFPRWRNSRSKRSGLAYTEPGSPKVSCWGKVRSDREREKRRKQMEARKEIEKEKEKPSCCGGFSVILSCGGDRGAEKRGVSALTLAEVRPSSVEKTRQFMEKKGETSPAEEARRSPGEAQAVVATPATGLGALKRLSSGRRAASWGADVVAEEEGVAGEKKI